MSRPGFSLIEVILALTILLISLAAIGQLVDIGSDNGVQARFTARGTRLAEAKMAEVEAGAVDATSGNPGGPFENDDSAWSWSVASEPAGPANLYRVTVTVTRDLRGKPFQVTLSQLVLDPKATGTAAQAEVPPPPTDDAEMGAMP